MIPTKCLVFRFSNVEVNEKELRATRGAEALEIEPKAFRVLVYLVRHAGHLVTKNELLMAVWGETAVTDNSLTRAIALLRRALEDDPRQPRFIETISTAGYRFICPVDYEDPSQGSGEAQGTGGAPQVPPQVPDRALSSGTLPALEGSSARGRRWMILTASCVIAISAAAFFWNRRAPLPPPHISETVRITNDPRVSKFVIGTDGARIYLNTFHGLGQVPLTGGDITTLNIDGFAYGLSPDGMSLVVLLEPPDPKDKLSSMSVVGTSGSPNRPLARASSAAWSADGKQVIYATARKEMYSIPSSGGEPHLLRVMDGPNELYEFASSPDGTRIRFNWGPRKIMEMSPDGSNLHEVLPGWHPTDFKCCSSWSPDGSFFLFYATSTSEVTGYPAFQIWALDERHGGLHKPAADPVQLTFGPLAWINPPAFTRDGKKILANGNTWRGGLVRYNQQTRQVEPFLGGISADMVDVSRDGKLVLYAPFPGNVLVRANADGTDVRQIVSGFHPSNPRWSPNNSQIAYIYDNQDGFSLAYVVSAQGGTPVRALPDNKCCNENDPTWSPDGKQLALWVESPEGKTEAELEIVDVATHQVSHLPRPPKRTWSPRWSPDGRYIVCLTNPYPNTDGLELYDFKTQKWKILLTEKLSGNWPSWSHDSRWIYYLASDVFQRVRIARVSVDGGAPQQVADLPGLRLTGWDWTWFGIDHDDNPLLLRDEGTNEVYALTLER